MTSMSVTLQSAPPSTESTTRVVPVLCNNNCGGRCVLKAHVEDSIITRITTDDSPDSPEHPQLRACLKGRAMRNRIHDPKRLLHPMKRIGPRGSGRFTQISWDEAVDLIASNLQRVIATHGNQSVYIMYGTGDCGAVRGRESAQRLMNLLGGYLGYYNSYSAACLEYTAPFITGIRDTNSYQTLRHSKLIVMNGFNPAETVFETNSNYHLARAKDAGSRIVVIDPRLSETAATFADEWIPIRPTTDTALFVAMAYVILTERLHDQPFLDAHCSGFDDQHMPPGAASSLSFTNYLLGINDGIPKTPDWASPITGIPAETIQRLARDYASTKPAQLLQGLGPQRHAYGEQSVRAGITLAAMTGNIGILGGGWGGGEGATQLALPFGYLPTGTNPVKARIPVFAWTQAVAHGIEMTATDGLQHGPLHSNIKFIFNLASNTLVNQHADINRTTALLKNESLVDFIVTSDQVMTPSARFSDLVLPSDHSLERNDIGFPWSGQNYIVFGNKAVDPPGECKHEYWWASRVAERLGVGPQFTEGRTEVDWLRHIIDEARIQDPDIPSYEDLSRIGYFRKGPEEHVAFESEIHDPQNHPFKTPSGKIEIFSKTLHDLNNPEIGDTARYIPAWDGPSDPLAAKFPLQCIGPHIKRRTHSTFDDSPWMEEAEPQRISISPQDATPRGIRTGDRVEVFNDRGALVIEAFVTRRIRPGVVSIPQGAWYQPDNNGVCQRGCINVLTSQRRTPLAHGNAQHTILVEVRKLQGRR
jgi:anaerobic dimethyl sulfoxide reductase subunit A